MTIILAMDIYRELILDHYKHPRNFGHLGKPDGVAEENNFTCGDRICMEVKVITHNSQPTTIAEIRFSGEGCAVSQASASLLTEKVLGKSVEQILKLKTENVLDLLGIDLTPSRIKCAVLPLEVLQIAVQNIKI